MGDVQKNEIDGGEDVGECDRKLYTTDDADYCSLATHLLRTGSTFVVTSVNFGALSAAS